MDGSDPIDDLALRLYDAAADAALWPEVIADVAASLKASSGAFMVWDHAHDGFVTANHIGVDPAAEPLYDAHFGAIDPRGLVTQATPAGTVVRCHEHFDEDFVRRSELFNDYAIPFGNRHTMVARLSSD